MATFSFIFSRLSKGTCEAVTVFSAVCLFVKRNGTPRDFLAVNSVVNFFVRVFSLIRGAELIGLLSVVNLVGVTAVSLVGD